MQDLEFLQAPRMQALRDQAESSQNEDDKRRFLTALVREIIKALGDVAVSNLNDGINVNNLDEIKASLRNELSKANKPITDILNKLNLSTQEQTKFLKDVEKQAESEIDDSIQTVVIKRIKDKTEVTNLSDIVFPSTISINNLSSLEISLQELINKISELKLEVNIPAPQVNVQSPQVNIPETVFNFPEIDLSEVVSAITDNLKLIRKNSKSNPLAVRLTDGGDWIRELQTLNRSAAQTTQFMSDVSYIRDSNGNRINPATAEGLSFIGIGTAISNGNKTVTTAGTRVQLISVVTPCRYVIIVGKPANLGTIWVGGTTVAALSGRPLVALQSEKFDINDLSKIWIDTDTSGEGVSFAYIS